MRIFVLLTFILIPTLVLAQGLDGYDASKGLGSPTYKTKAPPPDVEAETIIENSDTVLRKAQSVLQQLDEEVGVKAPTPSRKPASHPGNRLAAAGSSDANALKLELNFEPGQLELEELQKSDILEQLFIPLKENSDMRVFIQSHAASPDKQQSASRRASLKRALAVQAFLASKGIEPTKMIVMPMGNTIQNANRIRLELSRI